VCLQNQFGHRSAAVCEAPAAPRTAIHASFSSHALRLILRTQPRSGFVRPSHHFEDNPWFLNKNFLRQQK